jgi:transposase
VITRGARRSWSPEQKQQIVAESLAPGARLSEIIQKYGIGSGQLSMWRREFATPLQGDVAQAAARFARVEIAASPRQPERSLTRDRVHAGGLIEIVLPDGVLVRVDARVDDPRPAPGYDEILTSKDYADASPIVSSGHPTDLSRIFGNLSTEMVRQMARSPMQCLLIINANDILRWLIQFTATDKLNLITWHDSAPPWDGQEERIVSRSPTPWLRPMWPAMPAKLLPWSVESNPAWRGGVFVGCARR